MLTRSAELKVLELYLNNLTTSFTINQISKKLKKPYPYTHKKINELILEGILSKNKIGHAHLCRLNLRNEKTIALISLVSIIKKEKFLKSNKELDTVLKTLLTIKDKINLKIAFATNDTIYVVLDKSEKKQILPFESRSHKLIFLTTEQLKKQLLSNPEILDQITILHSFETFYQIVESIFDNLRIAREKNTM